MKSRDVRVLFGRTNSVSGFSDLMVSRSMSSNVTVLNSEIEKKRREIVNLAKLLSEQEQLNASLHEQVIKLAMGAIMKE